MAVEKGDLVDVHYTVCLQNGSLIATNVATIGSNPDVSWVNGYHRPRTYRVETVIAGGEAPFPELEKLVVGMRTGEKKKVTLPSVGAFGKRDSRLVLEFPSVRRVPKVAEEPIAKIVQRTHQFPEQGSTFTYGGYFLATVEELLEDTVRLELRPRYETVQEPFGTVHIVDQGDEFVLKLEAERGEDFTWRNTKGVIKAADDHSFVVDFNHPLAGKEIQYQVEVAAVVKASDAERLTIDWMESYEDGLQKAEQSHKRAVLVLYSTRCGVCEKYLATTLKDIRLRLLHDKFVWIKVEAGDKEELKEKYGLRGYPLTIVVDCTGESLEKMRGYQPAEKMRDFLIPLVEADAGSISAKRKL
jgi:FKBP-type peptidyl-prolyl cis-trans isomerase 2